MSKIIIDSDILKNRITKLRLDFDESHPVDKTSISLIISTLDSILQQGEEYNENEAIEEDKIYVPDTRNAKIKGKLYLQSKGMRLSSNIAEYKPSNIYDAYQEGFKDGIYYQKSKLYKDERKHKQ